MIVAQLGLGFGILYRSCYGVVVFMSVATTILASPLIKIANQQRLLIGAPDVGEKAIRLG